MSTAARRSPVTSSRTIRETSIGAARRPHGAALDLEEIHVGGVVGGDEEAQLAGQVAGPPRNRRRVLDGRRRAGLAAAGRRRGQGEDRLEAVERAAQLQPGVEVIGEPFRRQTHPVLDAGAPGPGQRQGAEEGARVVEHPHQPAGGVVGGAVATEAAHRGVGVPDQVVDPVVAHRDAEVLRGDVLELVRLVHDQVRARRNHLAVGALAHRGIGAQQVVVDDDDVGLGGALPHPGHEALAVARTVAAQAGLGGGRDLVPQRQVLGQIGQLGAIAGLGLRHPALDDRQEDRVVGSEAPALHLLAAVVLGEPVQAQVVGPALHAGGGEGHAERLAQHRHVLGEDLLLQILGAGRDQDAVAAQDGRHQVGHGLARAGAGLGEQHPALVEDGGDRGGHVALAGTRFELRKRSGQRAVVGEGVGYAGREAATVQRERLAQLLDLALDGRGHARRRRARPARA